MMRGLRRDPRRQRGWIEERGRLPRDHHQRQRRIQARRGRGHRDRGRRLHPHQRELRPPSARCHDRVAAAIDDDRRGVRRDQDGQRGDPARPMRRLRPRRDVRPSDDGDDPVAEDMQRARGSHETRTARPGRRIPGLRAWSTSSSFAHAEHRSSRATPTLMKRERRGGANPIDDKIVRAIAFRLGAASTARYTRRDDDRVLIDTEPWGWELERVPPPPAVSSPLKVDMYLASPDVFTSGGAGLRSRWFAFAGSRIRDLHDAAHMRWFLAHRVSSTSPVDLAELLECCQGTGRMANVYVADGRLETRLGDRSLSTLEQLGVARPAMEGGELTFYSWRIVMLDAEEVIEVERWSLAMNGPEGPTWSTTRLPGLLRSGD
jgi:hypothetical protein